MSSMKRVPWLFEPEPSPSDFDKLWIEVRDYLYQHNDLSDERLFHVLTAWVFATYCVEKWRSVPYIFSYGPRNSGKSRLLESLRYLSYRGVKTSDISDSAMYRILEEFHPTMFLDESEIYLSSQREMQSILNAGYRRGDVVIRVKNPKTNELGFFDVFGFKALAGTNELRDTLESRCICISMQKNIRPVNFRIDEDRAMQLRSKLLYWCKERLGGFEGTPKDIPEDLKFSDGRFAELFTPLVIIAPTQQRSIIVDYAKELYEIVKGVDEVSIEAEVLMALVNSEQYVIQGRIATNRIALMYNLNRPTNERIKSIGLGRIVKRLGFKPKRTESGYSGWIWNQRLIDRLIRRYNLEAIQKKIL